MIRVHVVFLMFLLDFFPKVGLLHSLSTSFVCCKIWGYPPRIRASCSPDFCCVICVAGAGQDVGKSCVVVTMGGKNIMFDCGMHMGYQDERRYPDFSFISKTGNFTQAIDCVIVTHL